MNLAYKEFSLGCRRTASFLSSFFNELPEGGRFYCNILRSQNIEAYIPRAGEWSDPWPNYLLPGLEIPDYNNSFDLTFSEVSDLRGLEIKKLINETGRKVVLSYSGGIDSTVCLVSLLKNLNKQELENVVISMTSDSIIENPEFYSKYIKNKLKVVDLTNHYHSDFILNENCYVISADLGDFILGTELGTKMYSQIPYLEKEIGSRESLHKYVNDPTVHYSKYKNIIALYLNKVLERNIQTLNAQSFEKGFLDINSSDRLFGELFYEKVHKNIQTSNAPVYSLHDFFWWTMFNIKFAWGALRAGIDYGSGINLDKVLNDGMIPWYISKEYQLWSLKNNNNGEKIKGITQGLYKWAPKKYIHEFDKNDWYFRHKIKIASGPILMKRIWWKNYKEFDRRIGMDQNYQPIMIDSTGVNEQIKTGLYNYKIDWV